MTAVVKSEVVDDPADEKKAIKTRYAQPKVVSTYLPCRRS